jgi:hypothetical protein
VVEVVEVVCFSLVSDSSGFSSLAPASTLSGSVVEADPSITTEVVVGPVSVATVSASDTEASASGFVVEVSLFDVSLLGDRGTVDVPPQLKETKANTSKATNNAGCFMGISPP